MLKPALLDAQEITRRITWDFLSAEYCSAA